MVASLSCTIPMSAFRIAPFNMPVGALIAGVAEAYNAVGYSTPSVENIVGATFRSAPIAAVTGFTRGP